MATDVRIIEVVIQAIQQVGFPIIVAIYLIWRHEQILQQVVNRINELENVIIRIQAKLEEMEKYVDNDNR